MSPVPLGVDVRHLTRLVVLALAAVMLVAAPVAATDGSSVQALATTKVVIIVGPTGSSTAGLRSSADAIYAEAINYSSNVTRIYSPNATWAVVKPALQGANLVIYLGHGNGWPSPYTFDPNYTTKDGFGLNATAGSGDSNHVYYGEPYMAQAKLAPNALVLLNHLCYSAGNSESWDKEPTLSVAQQRVDNYGQGFLKGGAGVVIASAHGNVVALVHDLFTTQQTIANAWRGQYDYNGNEISFPSFRSPTNTVIMDPETPTGGYYRSLIGKPDLLTTDITGAPSVGSEPPPAADPTGLTRLAGTDRYATAVAVSQTFAAGVPVVYIATGLNFPDALAGAAAAGETGGPVLLVRQDSIPAATAAELARLRPGRIIVLGGTGVVSDAVVAGLGAYASGGVARLSGVNRYATAAAISTDTYDPGVPLVFLATGQDFPDALVGAAAAGAVQAPMLLVTKSSLPTATAAELARLQPGRIILFGTTDSVSDAVLAAVSAYAPGGVIRVAGTDKYSTAAAISAATKAPGVPVAYIATGLDFPDALAGAAVGGLTQGPLLLVTRDSIPAATVTELLRLRPGRIVILGGTGVVSDAVQTQLLSLIGN